MFNIRRIFEKCLVIKFAKAIKDKGLFDYKDGDDNDWDDDGSSNEKDDSSTVTLYH